MVSECLSVSVVHAENAHAQSADGTGNPVAIKFKLLQTGTLDIGARVHFHAVDNGKEIVLVQAKPSNDFRETFKTVRNTPGIERIDVFSPF